MEPTITLLGYLAAHRLMMFVAGTVSIVLGYRLLMAGLSSDVPMKANAEPKDQLLSARLWGATFSMRNLAPGTAFAFFGAAMLTGVAIHRPPEIKFENIATGGSRSEFRGTPMAAAGASTVDAIQLVRNGETVAGLTLARKAIRRLADELNDIAWVLVTANGDAKLALSLSEAAVAIDERNATYLDTLATALSANGRHDAAVAALERASREDPKYRANLEKLRGAAPRR